MATYYVRKNGSNSNNGTSASSAWLTLTYALTSAGGNPAGGSIIYIGAGVYRETVATTVSGASLSGTYNGSNGASLATIGSTLTLTATTGLVAPPAGYYNTGQLVTSAGNVQFTYTGISGSNLTGVVFMTNATVTSAATVASSAVCIVGSPTWVIGDVDGAQTGDAGQVTLSGYTTNDKTSTSNTVLLAFGSQSYLAFAKMTFITAGTGGIVTNAQGGAIGTIFTDCVFNWVGGGSTAAIAASSSTTGLALNWLIDRCSIVSSVTGTLTVNLTATTSGSADYDALVLVRNCFLLGGFNSNNVTQIVGTSNTHLGGGARFYNCTMVGYNGPTTTTASDLSTAIPCEVHGSFIMAGHVGINAATLGQFVESYNIISGSTTRTNVTAGTGSIVVGTYASLLELGQSYKWGGVIRQFMAPDGPSSPLLGFGSDGSGSDPSVDWMNRPRPSGGQSSLSAVGYDELHDFAVEDLVTYNDSPASAKLIGPGDQDILVPVDETASVLSIYVRFDALYGGTNYPSATLLASGELAVTAQTQTCSSSSATWQKLTFSSITATKAGYVKVRITSFDTSGVSAVNFDTLGAT